MEAKQISTADWIVGGVAVLLVIDLLFLPWVDISIGPFSATSVGTGAPDGILGVLGMLAALAYAADLGIQRFTSTELPAIGGSRERTRLILAGLAVGFVWLKFVLHLSHTGDLGIGAWLALVASAALAVLTARPDLLKSV